MDVLQKAILAHRALNGQRHERDFGRCTAVAATAPDVAG